MLDQRGQLLVAALGFARLRRPSYDLSLWALRTLLGSWSGIGHVVVGMARQGFDLQLTPYDERGWRATFYTAGMEHSPTSATGTAWEPTPWERRSDPTAFSLLLTRRSSMDSMRLRADLSRPPFPMIGISSEGESRG